MPRDAHPPMPGPIVQPNVLPVMEALATVDFPITKQQLIHEAGDRIVVVDGTNVDLRDIISQIHDDSFRDMNELSVALERFYTGDMIEGGDLPTTRIDPNDILEPPDF